MPIKLPTIDDAHFQGMTVCGHLRTEDWDVLDRLFDAPKTKEMFADVASGERQLILGILWGTKDSKHVHADLVDRDIYKTKRELPRIELRDILNRFDSLLGQQIDVTIFGRFRFPIDMLPKGGLIDGARFVAKEGRISVAVTGGELAIEGPPIDTLSWRIRPDQTVVADLSGKWDLIVEDDYFTKCYWLLNQCFNILVLGRQSDADL